MKYGIFAATPHGCQRALQVAEALSGCQGEAEIWVQAKQAHVMEALLASAKAKWQGYSALKNVIAEAWERCDGLVFIMAAGIVVRTIAPYLASKLSDPAVLVMDDGGRNIISLLSGHIGGANRLTSYLAGRLGANPVITTATDVNHLLAPDVVAAELQCLPVPKHNLLLFNGSLLSGRRLVYWVDAELKAMSDYQPVLEKHQLGYELVHNLAKRVAEVDSDELYVVLTDKSEDLPQRENILYLQPRCLIAGVGCRRGTDKSLIQKALEAACSSIGWSTGRLSRLASTVVKSDEAGMLAMADELKIPIAFFDNAKLADSIEKYKLEESVFVKKNIGVGNICEAAALCSVPKGKIALPKHKYEKVTVALVWQK